MGFPIRKSSDQSSFAAPQGLSQRTTSFIASQRQGIHRTPLRHLITLMIDVRRPRAATIDRKTIARDGLSAARTYACQPGPRSTRRFKRYGWSARDVDPRFSNLVPLHDFKHPRLPHLGAIDANLNDTGQGRDTLGKAGCLGGARRDRTDDLMLAKRALSQLSYGPFHKDSSREAVPAVMVGLGRLERPTSPLSGVRSNHLSYRPELSQGEPRGYQPRSAP